MTRIHGRSLTHARRRRKSERKCRKLLACFCVYGKIGRFFRLLFPYCGTSPYFLSGERGERGICQGILSGASREGRRIQGGISFAHASYPLYLPTHSLLSSGNSPTFLRWARLLRPQAIIPHQTVNSQPCLLFPFPIPGCLLPSCAHSIYVLVFFFFFLLLQLLLGFRPLSFSRQAKRPYSQAFFLPWAVYST